MKSVVMGFWLLAVSLGNKLVALLAGFEDMRPVPFFWTFAVLMAIAAVIFALRARTFRYQDRTQ
jgi:dipeptide/tripeptide permease